MSEKIKKRKQPKVLKRKGREIAEAMLFHDDMDEELLEKWEKEELAKRMKTASQDKAAREEKRVLEEKKDAKPDRTLSIEREPSKKREIVLSGEEEAHQKREVLLKGEEQGLRRKELDLSKEEEEQRDCREILLRGEEESARRQELLLEEEKPPPSVHEKSPEYPEGALGVQDQLEDEVTREWSEGPEKSKSRPIRWLLLLILFVGAAGAGFWGGRKYMEGDPTGATGLHSAIDNLPPLSEHVVKGLFCPLEDGRRTLYLSLRLRMERYVEDPQLQHRWLCGVIYEAAQGMKADDLGGYPGMKALKARIKNLIQGGEPALAVEDIHFLEYTVL